MKSKYLVHALALAVSSACLASPAFAADSGAADQKKGRYMLLAPQSAPFARATTSAMRAGQLASIQVGAASSLRTLGVKVDKQLAHAAPISFADLTQAQVKALQSRGFKVAPVGVKKLLSTRLAAETIPYGIAKVRAPESWATSTGTGRKVCVIDTGIDYNHPDLAPNFVEGISTVGAGSPDPMDVHGHGTHVSGTIAAAMNDADVVGVAPTASIYTAAVFSASGTATDEDILEGVDWCVSKDVNIFSMSYGGGAPTEVEEAAYRAAFDAGILLVAATGNDGNSVDASYPAAYPFIVAIGATDSLDQIASFSQRKADLTAPGVGTVSDAVGGGTTTMSGTSMATPHVSGVAAALWAAHPGLSNVQVEEAMALTAIDLGAPGLDPLYGHGRVDLRSALDYAETGNLPPTAKFLFNVLATDPLSVLLRDQSVDPNGDALVSWAWDFGDGTSGSGKNARHTYAAAGEYAVVLTVTDASGSSRAVSKVVRVGPVGNPYLQKDTPVLLSGAAGSVKRLRLRVPADAENLRIQTSGGTGDADLYVRFGAEPTPSVFDCRPYIDGSNELCSFSVPQAGVYFINLVGFSAYENVQLVASWDIVGAPTGPSFENTTDFPIPDGDEAGVESPLSVDRSGESGTVKVRVDIKHTYRGDLIVDLVSPSGAVFNLHNGAGGAADNLLEQYNVAVGAESSAGQWKLRVKDRYPQDTGFIDSWKLTFAN